MGVVAADGLAIELGIADRFIIARILLNEAFVSTPHKVINNTRQQRFSIPFFFSPNSEYVVDAIDVFATQDPIKLDWTCDYQLGGFVGEKL